MIKLGTKLALCMGVTMTSGCASILCKSTATVAVFSNDHGATVTVKQGDDVFTRQSIPSTLQLPPKQSYVFQFEKAGSFPLSASLSRSLNSQSILSLIVPPWFIVDMCTGAWRTIDDSAFYVDFLSTSGVNSTGVVQPELQAITLVNGARGFIGHSIKYNLNHEIVNTELIVDTFTVGKSTVQDFLNRGQLHCPVRILSSGNLQYMEGYLSCDRIYKTGKTLLNVGAGTRRGNIVFIFDANRVLYRIAIGENS